jgi:hypothetical protein
MSKCKNPIAFGLSYYRIETDARVVFQVIVWSHQSQSRNHTLVCWLKSNILNIVVVISKVLFSRIMARIPKRHFEPKHRSCSLIIFRWWSDNVLSSLVSHLQKIIKCCSYVSLFAFRASCWCSVCQLRSSQTGGKTSSSSGNSDDVTS